METKPNGSSGSTQLEAGHVTIGPGNQVVVVKNPDEAPSPEEIQAQAARWAAILNSPTAAKIIDGLFGMKAAQANAEATAGAAEVEKARLQAEQQEKARKEQNEKAFAFATRFLYCLSGTGALALTLVGVFAWTGALKDASLSAFAMFVVGSIFGGTIYGTTLRKQEKP